MCVTVVTMHKSTMARIEHISMKETTIIPKWYESDNFVQDSQDNYYTIINIQ